jgi:hypothetical protein
MKEQKGCFHDLLLPAFAVLVLAGIVLVGRWVAVPGMILFAYIAFIGLENGRRRRHCEYLRCRDGEEDDE